MSSEKSKVEKAGPAVVSFPDVFNAAETPSGKMRYGVTLIFKPQHEKSLTALRKVADAAIKRAFPDGKVPKSFQLPFRDGEEYSEHTGYDPGDTFVRFSRDADFGALPIVGPSCTPIERAEVYPGILGVVAYRPFVWHHKKTNKRGLSFGLEGFQKVSDGERLGGYAPINPDEVFSDQSAES
jgi:hypothetical protein